MDMETLWARITAYAGEEFHTVTGKPFTYHVQHHSVVLENTNRKLPYSNFETALTVEHPSPAAFQKCNLQGPSYIFGILTDERICKP